VNWNSSVLSNGPSLNGWEKLKLIGPNPVIQVTPTPIEYLKSSTEGSKQLI
jgi:hypothetical protein